MSDQTRPRAISNWLFFVALLVFLMVVVGGITRLTESGLSITEWRPISGALPPLNAADWNEAFALYKATPEYQQINRGMSLADFKFIYFWEWFHRLLGRVIGLAFALPLLWFWWRRAIPAGQGRKLVALLALGALQGAIGWWMVASGLVDRPDVSHIRLAVHLLTALAIFAGLLWVALDMDRIARTGDASTAAAAVRAPTLALWAISILFLQFLFGAYVAGLDAGFAFNSWPKMGGEWFPSDTPMLSPFLSNFADNPVVVQFVHRWLAFVVAGAAIALAVAAWRARVRLPAAALCAAVLIQIELGIMTLLSGVDIRIAAGHQAMAVMLLGAMVVTAHRMGERRIAEGVGR
jgi:cytochrome c oxidase assembly protein subunit 15